ncbi:MAG: TspO/MBR family protein [Pseudomonadota bacterium]
MPEQYYPIAVTVGLVLIAAIGGGGLTQIGPWYRSLKKSSLNPPDWAFPTAWTLIYLITGTAGVLAWRSLEPGDDRLIFLGLVGVNLILNVAWSGLFFTLQRPDWALFEVVALWLSVLALCLWVLPANQVAGTLFLPYLVWTAFAAWLNFRVFVLNRPFA